MVHDLENPDRRIVVCADDFGLNPAVNAGVLALGAQGRLTGTSVLVDGSALSVEAIAAVQATGLQLGLHLNLTEAFGQPGVCVPLSRLIVLAQCRRLKTAALYAAFTRQLTVFQDRFGRDPDYIDGHQHVHQLPLIRDVMIDVLMTRTTRRPWVRDVSRLRVAPRRWTGRLKPWIVAHLGAAGLRRRLDAAGLRHNPGFLGVYDFKGGASGYAARVRDWLALCQPGDVLMCHPAQGDSIHDPLSTQRQAEFRILSGLGFQRGLAHHHLTIARGDVDPEELI